ncbi:ATP-binding protein [Shewanella colwelliana]|uniref:histidine kinase n=1 Tax=Shewanella colwelliana TaxID=23 RepID=A0ABQ4NWP0_SHECO|nr:ATP-binding protein [Shewanella colwelliana]MDX1281125.1 ATP-binding protein [Shewanella colwelliana]GIU37985.1 two-component sensor histidine kinase [Shewanella colwelliana]
MKVSHLPNNIFIKLLLSFWLCSSLIIATVGLLPLLQQNHDRAPIPPHLVNLLDRIAKRIQANPELITTQRDRRWHRFREMNNKPVRFYLANAQGQILNTEHPSRAIRRFMLMADDATRPISHQFKSELLFGPHTFEVNGEQYSLYGRLAEMHPRPWFFFFAENIILTLALAILLSGLLCALLAWHLGKPLRALKHSAEAVASGDLGHRADSSTTKRKDEIGQLAQSFNAMAGAIESMVNSQQRLISDISHELRTPLTRLQLALALARKKGQTSTELERISYEAEQLEAMIAELLELSRVKLNLHENKHHLSLSETLGQVLDDAEFEAAQQDKQLNIDIDEQLCFAMTPRPLARAIENLLRNAIRYANQNVSIHAIQHPEQIELTIADDGPGIEDERDLQAIFEPFYRPQSARERESGGWGLGLAIAKAAIDAHKGKITASNLSPHGLKITIRLPK